MGIGLRTTARVTRRHGWRAGIDYATRRPLVRFANQGRSYVLPNDGSTEYHLRESTSKLARLAATISDDDRYVLDVGAHSGLFAAMALDRHQGLSVVCIEPDITLRPALAANLRGRGEVVEAAVGDKPGMATLWRVPSSTQTNSLDEEAARAFGDARPVTVPITTIDKVVADLGWPQVDVLKLDVQGAEAAALDGCGSTLANVRTMLVEVSFLDPDPAAILNRLEDEFHTRPRPINAVHMGADLVYTRPR